MTRSGVPTSGPGFTSSVAGEAEIAASASPATHRGRAERYVSQREHPHEMAFLHDRQTADSAFGHQRPGIAELHVGRYGLDAAHGRDITEGNRSRILPFGDDTKDEVAIGDQSDERVPFGDGEGADVVCGHERGRVSRVHVR